MEFCIYEISIVIYASKIQVSKKLSNTLIHACTSSFIRPERTIVYVAATSNQGSCRVLKNAECYIPSNIHVYYKLMVLCLKPTFLKRITTEVHQSCGIYCTLSIQKDLRFALVDLWLCVALTILLYSPIRILHQMWWHRFTEFCVIDFSLIGKCRNKDDLPQNISTLSVRPFISFIVIIAQCIHI